MSIVSDNSWYDLQAFVTIAIIMRMMYFASNFVLTGGCIETYCCVLASKPPFKELYIIWNLLLNIVVGGKPNGNVLQWSLLYPSTS
jgi:hypothetical protein